MSGLFQSRRVYPLDMQLLVDDEPWRHVTDHLGRSRGRVWAAIGYVGASAGQVLILKAGDTLVCDASDLAVRDGSTSPAALREMMNAGVEVFSAPGLHAKVIATRGRAYVGSANASLHSKNQLDEAVVVVTDTQVVQEVRAFVASKATEMNRLTASDLTRLDSLPVRKRVPPQTRLRVSEVPREVPVLRIAHCHYEDWAAASDQAFESERKSTRRRASHLGSNVRVSALEWWVSDLGGIVEGDWLMETYQDGGRVYSPGLVVRISRTTPKRCLVWVARPKPARWFVSWSNFKTVMRATGLDPDAGHRLTGAKSAVLLAQFRA